MFSSPSSNINSPSQMSSSSSSSSSSGLVLPDLSNVDLSSLPQMMQQQNKPKLSYGAEIANRCGISYFSGLLASGTYGAVHGWTKAQKGIPFRLRLNSVINHSIKLGANNGNMFACLALYFVTFKRLYPKVSPIDIREDVNLIISGATAGMIWKTFHPWKQIARFGLVGATLPAIYVAIIRAHDEGYL